MAESRKTELFKELEALECCVDAAFTHFELNEQLDAFDKMSDVELEEYLLRSRPAR